MDPTHEFSHQDPAQPMYATIADLPTEILLKILREDDEFKTQRALRTLRLLSRGLNAIVQDRAVEYIRIRGDSKKVQAMAASPSTFDRSAKTLRLEGFEYPPGHQGWTTLATLIKKMRVLQEIQWIDRGMLNDVVIDAMGHLPLLETIDFTFLRTSPSNVRRLPEAMFARLKSITLNFPCYLLTGNLGPVGGDKTKGNIRYLISNTPRLEHLAIGPEEIADLVSIDEGVGVSTNSRTSLLSVAAKAVALLPTSTGSIPPFLSKLSTLEVPNYRSSDRAVWQALRVSGIKLSTIKVDVPTVALMEYLRSYQGLQSFHMGGCMSDSARWTSQSYDSDEILNQLLTIALFEHRTTLVDLRFCATRDFSYIRPAWSGCMLSDVQAGHLLRFRQLERLDLVFKVPNHVLAIQSIFAFALNTLSMLSNNLKTVYVHVVGVESHRTLPDRLEPSSDPFRTLLQAIEQFRFDIQPMNWELMQVVVRTFEPNFTIPGLPQVITHIAYRIVPLDDREKSYCLKVDYVCTELLNEKNDYHAGTPVGF